MIFSTAGEIVKAGAGVFSPNDKLRENARSATAAAWGSLFLLGVSAWLSQPIYYAYAAQQHAAQADLLSWIFAVAIALAVFGFGSDLARNAARMMRGKEVDRPGVILLTASIWLGLAGFDVLVQYYGSEIKAREASGNVQTVAAAGAAADPYAGEVEELLAELAAVDFEKSWCGKHRSKHGNSYADAMSQTAPGAEWKFNCEAHKPSWGSSFNRRRDEIRADIRDYRKLSKDAATVAAASLADQNEGVLKLRGAIEGTYKFMTFALYVICFLFGVRVSLYIEDWNETQAGKKYRAQQQVEEQQEERPRRRDRGRAAGGIFAGLFGRAAKPRQARAQQDEEQEADLEEEKKQEESRQREREDLYRRQRIGFATGAGQNRNVSQGNLPPLPPQNRQPPKAKNRQFATRADAAESRKAVLAAYRSIKQAGANPTYSAIAQATNLSPRTVGTYVRSLKSEGII